METDNLGSKKMNNKENVNEGFSGEKQAVVNNPPPILTTDVEIDLNGNPKVVQRAHNADGSPAEVPHMNDTNNQNISNNLSEEEIKRTIENRDRNSDITANRHPNANPDNQVDRGNIKLDEG